MKPEYTLYLDESYDDASDLFCIAGCTFNDSNKGNIEKSIEEIKNIVWTTDEIQNLKPVLHSTELNFVYKNRSNPDRAKLSNGAYVAYAQNTKDDITEKYNKVYAKLSETIKKQEIITFCCIIDRNRFRSIYALPSTPRLLDDWYDIAMQEIIEAFTHFLCNVNGVGSIVYEARDNGTANHSSTSDNKMFHNFCKIKVNGKGTDYLTNRTIYEHIRFMNIVTKTENIPGLQLADFIAFNYIKWYMRNENERTEFMKRIHSAAYNGLQSYTVFDARYHFGLKVLPVDYQIVDTLKAELGTLRSAYNKVKTDRNNIRRKNTKIIQEKRLLQEELELAKQEIEQLKKKSVRNDSTSDESV